MDTVLTLTAGENRPLPSTAVTVSVRSASPVNTSAILLTDAGRVRSDADLIFYNQPSGPGVGYRSAGSADIISVDTAALPREIATVVVAASLDGTGPTSFATAGALSATLTGGGTELVFSPSGLTSEAAVVCLEIYRRNDVWKVRAVGQGYAAGLAGLATAFGIEVDDEPATPPPGRPPRVTDPQPWPPAASTPTAPPSTPEPPAPQWNTSSAPPPSPRPPVTAQPQGVPMHSDLFAPSHAEVTGQGIQKQGSKMCRVGLAGEVMARTGSMVAYQGNLKFEALGSGGLGRMMRQAMTGEGVPLMKVTGQGDLFLADAASDVHLIDLDGSDGLTINGANVLAFDSSLSYDIARVQGAGAMSNAGLFNCVFTGRGRIAITTDGTPVVLNVDAATYADPQAAVAWSSSLRTSVKSNDSFNLGTLMGRSTGERFTLEFSGRGFVVVQPSELPPGGFVGGTGGGGSAGSGAGGVLGGILGR
ncbi:AIM24 family protein [Gordonia sp. SCSIO 19800]|uniref:AIM24 family protein n=2 Tax=unclassified Gordonia (in: high G+C Gram-positive bacteria) TaxID=2657482 RepID=UPI001B8147BC|nr:AIM24 family protein [Gordonia sp. SCSIO 19800]MBR7191193.1 AIM24 family protein [Gordonia sp. SCSIO 19800]